jgi:hypothetical protein
MLRPVVSNAANGPKNADRTQRSVSKRNRSEEWRSVTTSCTKRKWWCSFVAIPTI